MELYLIRHGQSTNNASMVADPKDRVSDPPLTPLGHAQAEALARHLVDGYNPEVIGDVAFASRPGEADPRGFGITKLYCSPMQRSLETTLPISRATGLAPHVWVDIHEHGGIFLEHGDERGVIGYPGLSRSAILEKFPNYVIPETITEAGWWTGGMEDVTIAYGRAMRVAMRFREDAKTQPDERIAIVSHGTFMDALIKSLLNTLPGRDRWFFHYNTAITRIDLRPDGGLYIRYMNRINHLTPDQIT